MRPPCSALASIGSTSRAGAARARQQDYRKSENHAADHRHGQRQMRSDRICAESRSVTGTSKNSRCSNATNRPIAATTRPAIAPISAPRAISSISRAHERAQRTRNLEGRQRLPEASGGLPQGEIHRVGP